MATVQANGIEIYYDITGSGPPLTLIMGLACSARQWQYQKISKSVDKKDELVNCTRLQPIRNQSYFEQKKRTHRYCKSLISAW